MHSALGFLVLSIGLLIEAAEFVRTHVRDAKKPEVDVLRIVLWLSSKVVTGAGLVMLYENGWSDGVGGISLQALFFAMAFALAMYVMRRIARDRLRRLPGIIPITG